MKKNKIIYWSVGLIILITILAIGFNDNKTNKPTISSNNNSSLPLPILPKINNTINWQTYNIDYMNDDIKAILVKKLGSNGKTAFYLPETGYINVSRGTKYGVAFAIQNVKPKIPKGNEFAYNFKADPSSAKDCAVNVSEVQSWIERGWKSSGMISGQWREDYHDWYDAMTIYFAFPSNIKPCNVKYNFIITKDGLVYDSNILEFNLI